MRYFFLEYDKDGIEGFRFFNETEYNEWYASLEETEFTNEYGYPRDYDFGDELGYIHWDSFEDYLGSVTLREITKCDYNTLKKLFVDEYGTFPDPVGQFNG